MEEYDPWIDDMARGLRALQALQDRYDQVGWDISDPPFRKYRHICAHLSALVGKLSDLCERLDHSDAKGEAIDMQDYAGEIRESASNITFHMAQIANMGMFDLHEAMLDRYATNAKRFAPNSIFVSINTRK
jgi:hypothetical protein